MPEHKLPSIGKLFDQIDEVRTLSLQVAQKSTEWYEKELGAQLYELSNVTSDMLYLLREHLSCHDCVVVDHTHQLVGLPQPETAEVGQVFAHDMKGGEENGEEDSSDAS